jgi:hypothetical protein
MADLFSIRRQMDAEGEELTDRLKARRQATLEAERERVKRLVRLKVGIFFDPVTREVLRKVGSQYVFIRHDRRRGKLTREQAESSQLRLIAGGLFWDPKDHAIYQFRSGHYVLYTRDRRKSKGGGSPTGVERRKR